MRLWSLHPKYLDRQGLTALWREGLLAQAVLRGHTRGYRFHPQLARFRESTAPLGLISAYLHAVWKEGRRRGYHYDRRRISGRPGSGRLVVQRGQVQWEWGHLLRKLEARSPSFRAQWGTLECPQLHPIFQLVAGEVASWERGGSPPAAAGSRRA